MRRAAARRRSGWHCQAFRSRYRPHDQLPHEIDGTALRLGDRQELVDQPLGMDPTQGVRTDAELAGIIGHHDGAIEQPMPADGPPDSPCEAIFTGSGVPETPSDAERLEMRRPGLLVGKAALGMRDQPVDHRPGQMVPAHVGHRRLVDHVVVVTGAQAVEEVRA